MEAAAIIAAVEAAITIAEKLAPMIQAGIAKGEISPEVQSALDARIAALRPGGTAFAGPEWKLSTAPKA